MRVRARSVLFLRVGAPALLALVGAWGGLAAGEPDAPPRPRSLVDAARILGDALATDTWEAYEATLTTTDDVRRLEAAFAAAGDEESAREQLGNLRAFIERHGGHEGAARQQRADAITKCRAALAQAREEVGDVELRWGRLLPARTWLVADKPVRVQEEAFSLRAGDREVVFGGAAVQLDGGWSFSAGVSFHELMGNTVEKPDADTHPLAGPWAGLEADAGGALRDVTLWLAPQEQADRYVLHLLSTLGSIRGMAATSTHATGLTQEGSKLLGSGFDLRVLPEALRGTRDGRPFEVRRLPREIPAATTPLEKPVAMTLRGMAAVFDGSFADTQRVNYVMTSNGAAGAQSIAVRFRPQSGAEPPVAAFLKHDFTARLVEGRLRVAGQGLPWFEWYMQEESAFFRILVTTGGSLGPPPAIVHGYAHFK